MNTWKKFSKEVKGTFIKEFSWHSAKTEVIYKGVPIIFDNYNLWSGKFSKKMTRIVLPYYSIQNFILDIHENSLVDKIQKIFGSQDLQIGRTDFDKRFIIKSNDEHKATTILQNQKIRNLIESDKNVRVLISKNEGIWNEELPINQYELSFYDDGEITDLDRLKLLLELFKELTTVFIELKIMDLNNEKPSFD